MIVVVVVVVVVVAAAAMWFSPVCYVVFVICQGGSYSIMIAPSFLALTFNLLLKWLWPNCNCLLCKMNCDMFTFSLSLSLSLCVCVCVRSSCWREIASLSMEVLRLFSRVKSEFAIGNLVFKA